MFSRGTRRASVAVGTAQTKKDPRRASISALGFNQLTEEVYLLTKFKGSGSIEDLSAASGSSKNKISEILKKFIQRRPSKDTLRQKGILKENEEQTDSGNSSPTESYTDLGIVAFFLYKMGMITHEPVFGRLLEQITVNRSPQVPEFVELCIAQIESTEENMKTDGLYRASGNLSQVQKIRFEVDQNKLGCLETEEDVHVLAGALKMFFRELREPLIPYESFASAEFLRKDIGREKKIGELKQIVKNLPPPNRDTLNCLLTHLLKVVSFNSENRMDINNLSIVFGPTLTWQREDSLDAMSLTMKNSMVVEALLTEHKAVFTS